MMTAWIHYLNWTVKCCLSPGAEEFSSLLKCPHKINVILWSRVHMSKHLSNAGVANAQHVLFSSLLNTIFTEHILFKQ